MRQGGTVSSTGPLTAVGVWVYYVVAGGPSTVTARLYDGSHTLITSGTSSTSGWIPGWNLALVDTPYNWDGTSSLGFVAALSGTYRYDNSGYLPQSDSLVTVTQGIYDFNAGGYPGSTWSGLHGVAFAYTVAAPTIIDLGRITETTTMRALAAVKTAALGRITETDTVQPLMLSKSVTLGRVTETDTVRALGVSKTVAVGRVTETTTMRGLSLAKTIVLGRIVETTTMRGLTVAQPGVADMDVIVGAPRSGWHIGGPQISWHIGPVRT